MSMSPDGSILVELSATGQVIRTLLDSDGKTARLSTDVIELDGGVLYVGSYHEPYILRVDTHNL